MNIIDNLLVKVLEEILNDNEEVFKSAIYDKNLIQIIEDYKKISEKIVNFYNQEIKHSNEIGAFTFFINKYTDKIHEVTKNHMKKSLIEKRGMRDE